LKVGVDAQKAGVDIRSTQIDDALKIANAVRPPRLQDLNDGGNFQNTGRG
jgi:hypothetical protein